MAAPGGVDSYRAPLVLVPVQLARKSVRSGFKLGLHEDDIRLNPTLLQMLRRDFELLIPELEEHLPSSGSGVDVAKIWRIMRENVKGVRGFEVTDQVVLTTLSFAKYPLWKDLVDRTEQLKQSAVVKHLIDTPTRSYSNGEDDFISPSTLDYAVDPADLFTPLSADSSQVSAIIAAQRRKDFVLFGPPGTGKSQTIVNMITNCLAHAQTVLFVSQKTAALEVVRRRMDHVGPITSPTRPSQTSTPSTKPSMTPLSISTASASPIRWPCQESLLSFPLPRPRQSGDRRSTAAALGSSA